MLSNESLLFALNSGCLNSHAWIHMILSASPVISTLMAATYTGTVWRMSTLLIVVSHFVKVVFIQLPDEARKVTVLEMFRKDGFGESFILR